MLEYIIKLKPKFNGIYPRDNLPNKIKNGTNVINLDECSHIGTHWIALYALNNNVILIVMLFS